MDVGTSGECKAVGAASKRAAPSTALQPSFKRSSHCANRDVAAPATNSCLRVEEAKQLLQYRDSADKVLEQTSGSFGPKHFSVGRESLPEGDLGNHQHKSRDYQ